VIYRDLSIGRALRARQRGFLLNPFRFGGNAPAPSTTKLLLHCDGANDSTVFTDSSSDGRLVTAFGNAKITTTDPKFGTGAALFDGAGDYLQLASSTDFDLGTVYTIEFQIKPNSLASNFGVLHRGFYNSGTSVWSGLAFSIRWLGSACRFYFYGTAAGNERYLDVANAFSTIEWRHIAMVRNGLDGYVFVKGELAGVINSLDTPAASTQPLKVGVWDYSAGAEYFDGRLDEIRIKKGDAVYLSNFTPPAAAFTD